MASNPSHPPALLRHTKTVGLRGRIQARKNVTHLVLIGPPDQGGSAPPYSRDPYAHPVSCLQHPTQLR